MENKVNCPNCEKLRAAIQKEVEESSDCTTVANLAEALKKTSVQPEETGAIQLFGEV